MRHFTGLHHCLLRFCVYFFMFFRKVIRRYAPGKRELVEPNGIASPLLINGLYLSLAEDMVLYLIAHLPGYGHRFLLQLPVQLRGISQAFSSQLLRNPAYPDIVLLPDFLQEPGHQLLHAVLGSSLGFHEEEVLLCPGDGHVAEPPLLFQPQFFPLSQCLGGGKYPLCESQDEHHREL